MFYSILDISFKVMRLSARYAQFLTQQRVDKLSFCSYIFFAFIRVLISAAVYGKNKGYYYYFLSFVL